jgi:hypothetical protein
VKGNMKTANRFHAFKARVTLLSVDESGMSTVEYAIGTMVIYPCEALIGVEKRLWPVCRGL